MWIARDKDVSLWLFKKKPQKQKDGFWSVEYITDIILQLPKQILPEVKWEDKKPVKLITLPAIESIIDKLSDILSNYLHEGEIDEVIAEFETYLNKR